MNRNDIERANYLVNAKKVFRLKYNSILTCYVIILIAAYAFFFTSKMWMPTDHSSVKATRINSVNTWNNRDITLLSWQYCQAQNQMEVILSVNNKSYSEDNTYSYSAYYINKSGKKEVTEVINHKNLIVLSIENVPRNWGAICIHFGKGENNYTKLYATTDSVDNVESIVAKSYEEYMVAQLTRTIQYYENSIDSLKEKIDSYAETIRIAREKITELESQTEFLTDAQNQEIQKEISDALTTINTYDEKIKNANTSITEYSNRIININAEIKMYEGEQQ